MLTLQDWSSVATIVGVSLIVPQIFLAIVTLYYGNKRTRMKATLDYYESINQELKTAKRKSTRQFGTALTAEDITYLSENDDDKVLLHKILNLYDRLALGVNTGVYDVKLLFRLNGHLILANYKRYSLYIEDYLKNNGRSSWNEFSCLYLTLKNMKTNV